MATVAAGVRVCGLASACGFAVKLAATRVAAVAAHEASHAVVATLLGWRCSIDMRLIGCVLGTSVSRTKVPGLKPEAAAAAVVRHAGWLFSLALALAALISTASLATTPHTARPTAPPTALPHRPLPLPTSL